MRFTSRAAGFGALTLGVVGVLEIDCALEAPGGREATIATWRRRYGRSALRLLGVRVLAFGSHVEGGVPYPGRDARGLGRVFVMNHRSMLDIFVTLALFDAAILSRADLARWPVLGSGARLVGTLFVERGDKRSGAAAVDAMCKALAEGRGVMVYPEGGTHGGDELRPFHPGAFVAALRAGAEVVPAGIAYAESEAEFVDEPLATHARRVASARAAHVAVAVGEPFRRPGASVEELEGEARGQVRALVRKARALLGPRTASG
jgi:1-acyl-sn-glycerol-3-phosphate acyltransferase